MATQLTKTVNEATDQVVDIMEQAQEAASSVLKSVSDAVSTYVPELGLGEVLLSPDEVVESSFGIGAKFLNAGRKATLGILDAVEPVTGKIFGQKSGRPSPVKAASKSA